MIAAATGLGCALRAAAALTCALLLLPAGAAQAQQSDDAARGAAAASAGVAAAGPPARVALAGSFAGWQPVAAERLDGLRGGFDLGGLLVSFGIERAVYVNGSLVTTTSLQIADLSKLSSATAADLAQLSLPSLVQLGPGNSYDVIGSGNSLPANIIQNTLDNQNIRSTTVINAAANALSFIKSINSDDALRGAIANAVGRP